MGKAKFHDAADGQPARVAPTWTEEKLMILEAYLDAFATACKPAGGWYGLDLFAGNGLNWSATREREINGSPLIALEAGKPEATEVIVAERHTGAYKTLDSRLAKYGDRARPFPGDANKIVGSMLDRVRKRAPAFAFLDPEGSELEWPTVKAIADHKRNHSNKIEQLILLPTDMGFIRLIPDYPEKVTRMYGHDRWKEILTKRQAGKLSPEGARTEYVKLYAAGLEELGYETVLDRQIKKQNGQPMYFLIFATDHDAGERIMDHCFDQVRMRVQEELGQGQLFPVVDAPRRRRLGES